ncbi:MAG: ATP-grasp domain-containing protein [Synergistaceae bacterium]|nr:ATP-grasp domain-containing protein [Synergistaceae bacterium]
MIKNGGNFRVVGTAEHANCVYRSVCDAFETEPALENNEYVDFCLDFCKKHGIEIFVPRRAAVRVAERADEFRSAGVRVLVEEDEKMKTLSDKELTYAAVSSAGACRVPDRAVARTVAEFESAYGRLRKTSDKVCFKFAQDEGATSFRVVDPGAGVGLNSLKSPPGRKITFDDAVRALSASEPFPDLMIMPYLDGREVSADCLRTDDGSIIIPRFKTLGRAEEIRFDDGVISVCEKLLALFDLQCPCNIQFRYHDGVLRLLEINPRMSGGIQYSYAATGVNIPGIALHRLMGQRREWRMPRMPREGKVVSFVAMPVVLS